MKKYLKIFVVCFALVALLTLSCFATSVHTTGTTAAAYGHYISPGEYVFNEVLNFNVTSVNVFLDFRYRNNSDLFNGISINPLLLYFHGDSPSDNNGPRYDNGVWSDDDSRYITVIDGFYIYDTNIYQWWQSNLTRVSPGYDSNLLDGFFSSFTMIGQWISGATSSLTTMFWSNNSLTFLGMLAVSALGFAVAFLIIGLISRFLKFRG